MTPNDDKDIEERVRIIEIRCAARESLVTTMSDHERRIREFEKLTPLLKVNQYILMGLGGSVIALIWSLLTGQVTLFFP